MSDYTNEQLERSARILNDLIDDGWDYDDAPEGLKAERRLMVIAVVTAWLEPDGAAGGAGCDGVA